MVLFKGFLRVNNIVLIMVLLMVLIMVLIMLLIMANDG